MSSGKGGIYQSNSRALLFISPSTQDSENIIAVLLFSLQPVALLRFESYKGNVRLRVRRGRQEAD